MKISLVLALVTIVAFHGMAQNPSLTIPAAKTGDKDEKAPAVTQSEVQTAKSYDTGELLHIGTTLEGKLIKIKFSAREPQLTKLPNGSANGQVGNTYTRRDRSVFTTSEGRALAKESGFVEVVVPPEGVEWFIKVPSVMAGTAKTSVVYARVVIGGVSTAGVVAPGNGFGFHLELLGREAVTDLHGVHFIW